MLLLAVLIGGAFVAKNLYDRAMSVRGHLEQAMTEVAAVQRAILSGDADAAARASSELSVQTRAAVAESGGRAWGLAEGVPFVGDNFRAVRIVAETTAGLATDVVAPASAVNLDAFRPVGGRIDLAAVAALAPLLDTIDQGLADSVSSLSRIDSAGLLPEVQDGVQRLSDAVDRIQPLIAPARDIVSILPNALGGSGPRDYLLMFQGNSEARSLGGNPAVFLTVRTDGGAIAVSGEAQSRDFLQNRRAPIVPLSDDEVALYGDNIGRFTPDLTMVPDYPEAVRIAEGWWSEYFDEDFDAVISLDPVALSYLLDATGPVALPDGQSLTADNAVPLLLNEVYFQYDPDEQNVFFGAAAAGIFSKITAGQFAPDRFVTALDHAASEGRLLYWSRDPQETTLISGSRMAGVLPADTDDTSVVGVFVNDNTGSKKSYYLDMTIQTCRTPEAVGGDVTLTSSLTAEEAARLPGHIVGVNYPAGEISSYVVIYGPQGSSLQSLTLDGQPVDAVSTGEHLGRPAYKVEILHDFTASHVLSFSFAAAGAPGASVDVWHTPMTRETPVSTAEGCANG
ncbi:DUF4012 domain-containing protein [Microbacterium sp. K41]|uniref:DUF4012 domain-containing protein n=1 Tax=Microbacterium sp. K41 TaxID=2305437 RepID=UPI00109CEB0F|nr:DUF4012 domain-containing protein [Microbacterium sp. K41]